MGETEDQKPQEYVSPWVKGAAFVVGVAAPLFLGGVASHFSVIYSSLQRADDAIRSDIGKLEQRYFDLAGKVGSCITEQDARDLERKIERVESRCAKCEGSK